MKSLLLTQNDILDVTTVRQHPLGQKGVGLDDKEYRYAFFDNAVTAGKAVVPPANVANHLNRQCAAAAIGATEISVSIGATAATEDQYRGGTIWVNDGTGEGQSWTIRGNKAADSSGTLVVYLEGSVKTALVASGTSEVSVIPNKYNGVDTSTTVALRRVGVTVRDVAADSYAWIQTKGDCAVLIDGSAVAIADPVIPSTNAAGSVLGIGSNAATDQVVGYARLAGVDTEYQLIDLCIS